MAVIEAEMGEIGIVIDEGLEDFFGALGKKYVGKALLLNLLALAVDHAIDLDGGMVNLNAMLGEVFVGRFDPTVGGTEDVPMKRLACGLDIVGGHPCL